MWSSSAHAAQTLSSLTIGHQAFAKTAPLALMSMFKDVLIELQCPSFKRFGVTFYCVAAAK
jgi:hypothetical protein